MADESMGMAVALDQDGKTEEEFLSEYDITRYPQPSVTVDNVIFTVEDNDLRLLLVKRGGHPFLGRWALPGGFMSIDEDTRQAVIREVMEECNVTVGDGTGYFEQLATFSAVGRDPRGRIISVAYMTLLPQTQTDYMRAGDDADDASWFSVSGIGTDEIRLTQVIGEDADDEPVTLVIGTGDASDDSRLAFDHEDIVRLAVSRLSAKVTYSCLAFAFLASGQPFTMTDFRHVYEATTGRLYDMGNFQRMFRKTFKDKGIARVVGTTDTKGRPATTYEFVGKQYDIIVR